MTVPYVGHNNCRLAEIETLGKTVVATMMNDHIHLRNNAGLGEPVLDMHIGW